MLRSWWLAMDHSSCACVLGSFSSPSFVVEAHADVLQQQLVEEKIVERVPRLDACHGETRKSIGLGRDCAHMNCQPTCAFRIPACHALQISRGGWTAPRARGDVKDEPWRSARRPIRWTFMVALCRAVRRLAAMWL